MEQALLQNAFINYKGVSISIATYLELMSKEQPQDAITAQSEATSTMSIEELRDMFSKIHSKEVPNNKKNDAKWIYSKLNDNDSTTDTTVDQRSDTSL
jgi:hypothetical protein